MKETAVDLYTLWCPGLKSLKERYADAPRLFPGLAAFCGLHLTLWPMWLEACAEADAALSPSFHEQSLEDPELLQSPWRVLFGAFADQAAWVLVGGANLGDTAKYLAGLKNSDLVNSLAGLQSDGTVVLWGRTSEILSEWGAYKGQGKPLALPRISVSALEKDWSRWLDTATPLRKLLRGHAQEMAAQSHRDAELKRDYQNLASQIWQLMQEDGLITCAPAQKNSFLSIFGLRKEPQSFSGLFLLLGDHQAFWDKITKEE